MWNVTHLSTCLLSILVCPLFVIRYYVRRNVTHLFVQLYDSTLLNVECTHLYIYLLSMLVCPIFVDIVLSRSECHSFGKAIVGF